MPNPKIDKQATKRTRLWMMIPLAIFGGLVGIFAVQLLSGRDSGELPSALIGKTAPSFDLPALPGLMNDGQPVPALASTDLPGDLRLVNIFASWCAPCRAEHPVLMALAERYEVDIVGINYKDKDPNALKFLNELGNPYSRVGTDQPGRTAIEWGFYGIPETFLVDAKGVVRHKIVGPIDAKKFELLQAKITELKGN
ncbi:DsbE family thiol:disulfide interchange protein [Ahrensia sp. R2A130]|uniref:DsbE family thiol:disulfide interchange protein n=1 Tax=Ahrensia sp. R2A130 TaxID=744979 RepID=UPI0001E0A463|nr:DsbE family thiol:disulfide interchange protein [Ahrensia sp. R2A130]EFL89645.1 thiol:disulfide interchange protein CycY [Ahrensia sp. R2A130]